MSRIHAYLSELPAVLARYNLDTETPTEAVCLIVFDDGTGGVAIIDTKQTDLKITDVMARRSMEPIVLKPSMTQQAQNADSLLKGVVLTVGILGAVFVTTSVMMRIFWG